MNIEWLDDFRTLAETCNFTLAAKRQNVSQAAFSRRIQALENWVGVALVRRDSHPIRLTSAGQKFLTETDNVLLKLNETRTGLNNPKASEITKVHIVMPHVLTMSQFTRWWDHWSKDTQISASVSVGNVSEVIAKFISGSPDILICHNSRDFPLLFDPDNYLSHTIQHDRLSLYAPRKTANKFEARFPGSVNDPLPLLNYSQGTYFAHLVDNIIKRSDIKLNSTTKMEADMSSVILDFISQGMGIGWVPESCVSKSYDHKIRKLSAGGWSMNLMINIYMNARAPGGADNLLWQKITSTDF